MADTYRVKRGMVFWYNLDERVDKNSQPAICVDGRTYPDHRQYGMRHWLIISNNDGNASSSTCTIVPITGASGKTNIPTHVTVTFRGRQFEVLCEQIMTVNIVSLREYAYTLSDADMSKVERALSIQCSLTSVPRSSEIEQKFIQLEQRLENLMNRYEQSLKDLMESYEKRLDKLMKEKNDNPVPVHNKQSGNKTADKKAGSDKEFTHPTHTTDNGVKEKSSSHIPPNKHLSQIEKFNVRYPDAVPAVNPVLTTTAPSDSSIKPTGTKYRKWTPGMMQEYLNDTKSLSPMNIAEKWGLKNIRTVYSMKYYIQNQLKGVAKAN